MLKIFYGGNRVAAEQAIKRELGEGYEVFDGEMLEVGDLPNIFWGASLLEAGKRRILLKNVSENAAVWEKMADYVETEAEVIAWELKIDKRLAGTKALTAAGVTMREFPEMVAPEAKMVFNILDLAIRNGEAAVREVEKIELIQDPYMMFGLFVTQALKKYEQSGGAARERKLLKKLAELDMRMKMATVEPWVLIKAFLLEV